MRKLFSDHENKINKSKENVRNRQKIQDGIEDGKNSKDFASDSEKVWNKKDSKKKIQTWNFQKKI